MWYSILALIQQRTASFENYGDDIPATNLTATELRCMFGDEVCAQINGDECILTPPAEQWMEGVSTVIWRVVTGEGMAVLSFNDVHGSGFPSDFGGTVASDLDINDEVL
ncbi:MAG: hypothetical protein U0Z26_19630 [Anaerolineales bacterium]